MYKEEYFYVEYVYVRCVFGLSVTQSVSHGFFLYISIHLKTFKDFFFTEYLSFFSHLNFDCFRFYSKYRFVNVKIIFSVIMQTFLLFSCPPVILYVNLFFWFLMYFSFCLIFQLVLLHLNSMREWGGGGGGEDLTIHF